MDTSAQEWTLAPGQDVIGVDGEKLGEVRDALGNSFVVLRGWFFPTQYSIPSAANANVDGRAVYLNVTEDEALHRDWDRIPAPAADA